MAELSLLHKGGVRLLSGLAFLVRGSCCGRPLFGWHCPPAPLERKSYHRPLSNNRMRRAARVGMGGGMAVLIMIPCGPKVLLEGSVFIESPLDVGRCILRRGLPLVGALFWLSRTDCLAGWERMSARVHDCVRIPASETLCMVKKCF